MTTNPLPRRESRHDTVLDDPQEKQVYIEATTSMAQACEQASAGLLPFVDATSAARDMDAIRAALGESKLTYLGWGYGSFLGELYAHLFPARVRALALDGVANPALNVGDQLVGRAAGFEANLQAFLADCRSVAVCAFGQAGDPGARLTALIRRLDQSPLRVGSRTLGRRLAIAGLIVGVDPRRWRLQPSSLPSSPCACDQQARRRWPKIWVCLEDRCTNGRISCSATTHPHP